jgi:F-type H+-transporting ATPase subunit gamma
MENLEGIKRRIESTRDLQSVVKTMKALAAVRIRQYEKAVESLAVYNETVEMALRVVLQSRLRVLAGPAGPKHRLGAVVFGSDQGMCGQLNDQVVTHALEEMQRISGEERPARSLLAIGERVRVRLEDAGHLVEESLPVPGSVSGITPLVQDILGRIERWHEEHGINEISLFYSHPLSGARYEPRSLHLLPVDRDWLLRVRSRKWPNRCLPQFTMDWDPLFSALIRQYLFVSLFRACAESLASENASRLASMQGAERNIRDQLETLTMRYHRQRQAAITEELLDIVSGFEALETGESG